MKNDALLVVTWPMQGMQEDKQYQDAGHGLHLRSKIPCPYMSYTRETIEAMNMAISGTTGKRTACSHLFILTVVYRLSVPVVICQ